MDIETGDQKPYFRRGILTLIAVPLTAASLIWAVVVFDAIFYDSMGNYRAPSVFNVVFIGGWALAPLFGCGLLIYKDWKKPRAVVTPADE